MPVGNPAVTKTKHDSKKKNKTQKTSLSLFPNHIPAQPVLWLHMWSQCLIWSCLLLRQVGWPSGVSPRLIAVSQLSTASFWARGQPFLTLNASSGLAEVRPKPNSEIHQGLWVLPSPSPLTLFFRLGNHGGILCRHPSILAYMSCSVANLAI